MMIQFLHTKDCHIWKIALDVLEETLQELGKEIHYEVIQIENQEQARTYKFLGSPTILIDGMDIDPMARKMASFTVSSCRSYVYKNAVYEYPPKEMVIEGVTHA